MATQLFIFPFILLIALLFFVFWVIMLIDAATRKFKEDSEKIVWILVTILAGFIGALVYYFIVYRKFKSLKWFWSILLIILIILVILFLVLYFFSPIRV